MARTAQLLKLSTGEQTSLTITLRRGTTPARVQTRARVLDLLHRGRHPDEITATLCLSVQTIFNIKRRYMAEGLDAALIDKPRSGKPCRIDGVARAKITALACSKAPDGHACRTLLRLLADKSIEPGFCQTVSHTTVGECLKKPTSTAPQEVVVHRRGYAGEYLARMEDILHLYSLPVNERYIFLPL